MVVENYDMNNSANNKIMHIAFNNKKILKITMINEKLICILME